MAFSEFLTTKEVSTRYKIAKKTLCNYRTFGVGPKYHKVGRKVLYRAFDIEEWLKTKEIIPIHERSKLTFEEVERELAK